MEKWIKNRKFGLIGAGRVGSFFAALLKKKGLKVVGVSDIDERKAGAISRLLGLKGKNWRKRELAKISDVLLCATPDDEIIKVYEEINGCLKPRAIFCHFSGSLARDVFPAGFPILSLHPIYTLTPKDARKVLKEEPQIKFPFALEGDEEAINFGKRLMKAIGRDCIIIPTEKKDIYHLACVFLSNFLWATVWLGVNLIQDFLPRHHSLFPLASASLINAFFYPPKSAITGPIVRGDKETIRRHIEILKERFPQYLSLYRNLSRVIFDLVKGDIPPKKRREIERLIGGIS